MKVNSNELATKPIGVKFLFGWMRGTFIYDNSFSPFKGRQGPSYAQHHHVKGNERTPVTKENPLKPPIWVCIMRISHFIPFGYLYRGVCVCVFDGIVFLIPFVSIYHARTFVCR